MIKLTELSGSPILVNPQTISYIQQFQNLTRIYFQASGSIDVVETFSDIEKMVNKSTKTAKTYVR